jgi:hypothetical protein
VRSAGNVSRAKTLPLRDNATRARSPGPHHYDPERT